MQGHPNQDVEAVGARRIGTEPPRGASDVPVDPSGAGAAPGPVLRTDAGQFETGAMVEALPAKLGAGVEQRDDFYSRAPAAFYSLERNGTIRQANPAGADLLGVDRAGLLGRELGAFVAEIDRPVLASFLQRVFVTKARQSCEVRLAAEPLPGQSVVIEGAVTHDGEVCHAVAVGTMVSQRAGVTSLETAQGLCAAPTGTGERANLQSILTRIVDTGPVTVHAFRVAPNGAMSMVYSTRAIADIYGVKPEDLMADFTAAWEKIHPEDLPAIEHAIAESRRTMQPFGCDWRVRHPTRGEIWVACRSTPEAQRDGGVIWYGYFHDITERKRAEMLISGQNRVLELLATGRNLEEILTALVEIMEEQCHGAIGSILLMDEEGKHLRHGAAPRLPAAYTRAIDGVAIGPSVGSCGSAAFLRRPVVVKSIETDPRWAPYRQLALEHNLRACWSYPILSLDQRVLGTFAVYYNCCRGPSEAEERTIGAMTSLAGVAIEREHAESELRRREREYRTLAENSPDIIIRYDLECRRTFVNSAYEEQVGIPRAQAIGGEPSEGWRADLPVEEYRARLRQVMTTGVASEMLMRWIDPKGKQVTHLIRFAAEQDAEGRVIGALAIGRNIHALLEAERQLHTLVENIPDFIARFDAQCRHTYVNPSVTRQFGVPLDHFLGKTPLELGLPGHADRDVALQDSIKQAIDEGVPNVLEARWQTPAGERVFEVRHFPEQDERGVVVGVLGLARDVTEANRAEAALLESERKLAEAQRIAHVGYWELDPHTHSIAWSDETYRIFGMGVQEREMNFGSVQRMVHPDDRALMVSAVADAVAGGRRYEVEYRIVRPSGEVRTVHSQGDVTRDEAGRALRMFGTVQDVTERQRAEQEIRTLNATLEQRIRERTQELAHSERRFHSIFDSAPVSIWQQDWAEVLAAIEALRSKGVTDFPAYFRDHPEFVTGALDAVRIVDVNQWTLDLFAAREKSEILASLDTIFPRPDVLPGFVGALVALAQGRATDRTEMSLKTLKGNAILCYLTIALPRPGMGSDALVSVVDITERKRAEEALRGSEERYRLLFETMLQGVVHQDATGKIIFMNPAAVRILGKTPAEFMGLTSTTEENHAVRGDGSPFPVVEHPSMVALRTGREVRNVVMGVYNPREGATRWIDITAVPLFRAGEAAAYQVYTIFDDITERKRVGEEVAALNQEIRDRASALEIANKELEAFSYSVSHDLRAPLRSIDGFSRILLEDYSDKLDAGGVENLQTVRAASQRMGHLIDDMIMLSKVTRAELCRTPVDLSGLAGEVAAELHASDRDRRVECVVQPDLVAMADVRLIRIVLQNLLGNAWKFTGGKALARVEFGRTECDGKPAYFVRDNGAGFDPAYASKLFGAFQRLHSSSEFPGTGIGLATVQRVVGRHGGRVWAEGRPGSGATFFFTLSRETRAP